MLNTHARLKSEMHVYKAHVKDGKIELDEPAELPEGAQVHVTLVQQDEDVVFLDPNDGLSPKERASLVASLRAGLADVKAGRHMDMDEFLDQLESEP